MYFQPYTLVSADLAAIAVVTPPEAHDVRASISLKVKHHKATTMEGCDEDPGAS